MARWTKAKKILNFLAKVGEPDENGCMEWQGTFNPNGYGKAQFKVSDDYTYYGAHRVAYYLEHGDFDRDLVVCHSCDNKRCVNPDHLWIGTQKDNLADMVAKGRQGSVWKGRKHSHETIAKLKDKAKSKEHKERLSEAAKERFKNKENHPMYVNLSEGTLLEIVIRVKINGDTIQDVARDLGISWGIIKKRIMEFDDE